MSSHSRGKFVSGQYVTEPDLSEVMRHVHDLCGTRPDGGIGDRFPHPVLGLIQRSNVMEGVPRTKMWYVDKSYRPNPSQRFFVPPDLIPIPVGGPHQPPLDYFDRLDFPLKNKFPVSPEVILTVKVWYARHWNDPFLDVESKQYLLEHCKDMATLQALLRNEKKIADSPVVSVPGSTSLVSSSSSVQSRHRSAAGSSMSASDSSQLVHTRDGHIFPTGVMPASANFLNIFTGATDEDDAGSGMVKGPPAGGKRSRGVDTSAVLYPTLNILVRSAPEGGQEATLVKEEPTLKPGKRSRAANTPKVASDFAPPSFTSSFLTPLKVDSQEPSVLVSSGYVFDHVTGLVLRLSADGSDVDYDGIESLEKELTSSNHSSTILDVVSPKGGMKCGPLDAQALVQQLVASNPQLATQLTQTIYSAYIAGDGIIYLFDQLGLCVGSAKHKHLGGSGALEFKGLPMSNPITASVGSGTGPGASGVARQRPIVGISAVPVVGASASASGPGPAQPGFASIPKISVPSLGVGVPRVNVSMPAPVGSSTARTVGVAVPRVPSVSINIKPTVSK